MHPPMLSSGKDSHDVLPYAADPDVIGQEELNQAQVTTRQVKACCTVSMRTSPLSMHGRWPESTLHSCTHATHRHRRVGRQDVWLKGVGRMSGLTVSSASSLSPGWNSGAPAATCSAAPASASTRVLSATAASTAACAQELGQSVRHFIRKPDAPSVYESNSRT